MIADVRRGVVSPLLLPGEFGQGVAVPRNTQFILTSLLPNVDHRPRMFGLIEGILPPTANRLPPTAPVWLNDCAILRFSLLFNPA
jgi:hypothetical protein